MTVFPEDRDRKPSARRQLRLEGYINFFNSALQGSAQLASRKVRGFGVAINNS